MDDRRGPSGIFMLAGAATAAVLVVAWRRRRTQKMSHAEPGELIIDTPTPASASSDITTPASASSDTTLEQTTGYPFISQDTWIPLASVFINKVPHPSQRQSIFSVIDGSACAAPRIFFVRTDLLFDVIDLLLAHPTQFILITASNDDHCPPYLYYPCSNMQHIRAADALLDAPNLLCWFAKNPCIVAPKLRPLPLGPKWPRRRPGRESTAFRSDKTAHLELFRALSETSPSSRFREGRSAKSGWLYSNFKQTTKKSFYQPHRNVRVTCKAALLANGFEMSEITDFESYMRALADHKFCVAPPGRGIDTHRCWEALMVGTIPILLHTPLDSMFDGLPVVFTDDYATVTKEWLAARYEELQERPDETFDWARLHADHWVKSIQQEASSQREAKRRTM